MNRFDIILAKGSLSKKERSNISVLIEVTTFRKFDIALNRSSGDDTIQLELQSDQQVGLEDQIGIDSDGKAVLAGDDIEAIGVVSNFIGLLPNSGVLGTHPKLQNELNLDADHVIVDLDDWIKARDLLLKCNINSLSGNDIETELLMSDLDEEWNSQDSIETEGSTVDDYYEDDLPF